MIQRQSSSSRSSSTQWSKLKRRNHRLLILVTQTSVKFFIFLFCVLMIDWTTFRAAAKSSLYWILKSFAMFWAPKVKWHDLLILKLSTCSHQGTHICTFYCTITVHLLNLRLNENLKCFYILCFVSFSPVTNLAWTTTVILYSIMLLAVCYSLWGSGVLE